MATNNIPLVVIRCITYNHAPYIRQCLEGFVMQQTNFNYIAIVHDDCSTDGTTEIVREYAERFPNIIKPIFETENQWSKPGNPLRAIIDTAIEKTNAKYIAFCEGDDYWTDSNKLQRQVDFLDSHQEYVAIAENGLVMNQLTHTEYPFNKANSHDVTMEEVITTRRFPTAGVMERKDVIEGYKETCHIHIDTIHWCWLISKGKFRYENTISSVYRRGQQGMTVYTEPYAFAKTIEQWNMEILRVFKIRKSFIYLHIAKIYKSFIVPAIKRHHYISAIKCFINGFVFTIRAIIYKFFLRE